MRIILDDVPLMVSNVVKFQQGKPPMVGTGKILLDRNTDCRVIDFTRVDRTKCNPGEVNRTLQVVIIYLSTNITP